MVVHKSLLCRLLGLHFVSIRYSSLFIFISSIYNEIGIMRLFNDDVFQQFAGGYDMETMKAFEELRDKVRMGNSATCC